MRILEQTNTKLKLRQYPILLWLVGLFLIGAAGWAFWFQWWIQPVRDWTMLGVILFIALMGVGFITMTSMRTVLFDKTANSVTVQNKSILRATEKTYGLSKVQKVVTGTGREYDPSDRFFSRTHHILLIMKNGEQVQLGSGGKIQASRLYKTAVVIQRFIKNK